MGPQDRYRFQCKYNPLNLPRRRFSRVFHFHERLEVAGEVACLPQWAWAWAWAWAPTTRTPTRRSEETALRALSSAATTRPRTPRRPQVRGIHRRKNRTRVAHRVRGRARFWILGRSKSTCVGSIPLFSHQVCHEQVGTVLWTRRRRICKSFRPCRRCAHHIGTGAHKYNYAPARCQG